ncbi:MAG: hypothetical protein LC667_05530, partial [Thioalkalivibrio sp.]|nr:hypothetical protein [Thioalkalivibrio sp.]
MTALFLLWAVLLPLSVSAERKKHDEEITEARADTRRRLEDQARSFERALFRTPNLEVLPLYPRVFRKISTALRDRALEMDRNTVTAIRSRDIDLAQRAHAAHQAAIRKVLLGIAEVAKEFGRRTEES